MSTPFDPLALLRQNEEARKKAGNKGGFDPAALLEANARANQQRLTLPPGTSTISAETRPYYTAKPLEDFGIDLTAADIGEVLPAVGATVAGFAKRAPGAAGAVLSPVIQGVGGALGEAARQALAGMGGVPQQDAGNVLLEGGKQALLGAGGEVLGAAAHAGARTVRKVAERPTVREVERGAAEIGLPPPPESGPARWLVQNTMLGRSAARKGAKEGVGKAAEEVGEAAEQFDKQALQLRANAEADDAVSAAVREVLVDMGPQEAGQIIKGAIPAGQRIARGEAERLYKDVFEAADGVTVNIGDWKARMAALLKGTEPFEDAKLKRLRSFVYGTPGEGGLVEGGLPDEVPFRTAHELQSLLRETLPSFKLIVGRAKAPAKELRNELRDTINAALKEQNPAVIAPYKRANAFYAQYANVYDRSVVPKVVKANPEDFVESRLLPTKGISEAQALRRAIIGDAERYGTGEQKAAAKEAALAWQGTFVRQRLMQDGVENLPARLKEFHPEVLDTVMTATPEGRTLIGNLRTVSKAIEEAGPRIEAQIASEQERLRKVVSQPGNTPERAAAMNRLQLIEEVLARSEAATDKQSIWWSIAMGMGGFGYLGMKTVSPTVAITLAEASGGILAKALYDPAWAKQFARNVEIAGRSLEVGAPALARMVDIYMKREKRVEEQKNTWKYLTPPPSLVEPAHGPILDPFGLPPPPR